MRPDATDLASRIAELRRWLDELKAAQRIGADSVAFRLKSEAKDFSWNDLPGAPLPNVPVYVVGFFIDSGTQARFTFFDVSYRIYLDSTSAEIHPGHAEYPHIIPQGLATYDEVLGLYIWQWKVIPVTATPHRFYFQPFVQSLQEVEIVPL